MSACFSFALFTTVLSTSGPLTSQGRGNPGSRELYGWFDLLASYSKPISNQNKKEKILEKPWTNDVINRLSRSKIIESPKKIRAWRSWNTPETSRYLTSDWHERARIWNLRFQVELEILNWESEKRYDEAKAKARAKKRQKTTNTMGLINKIAERSIKRQNKETFQTFAERCSKRGRDANNHLTGPNSSNKISKQDTFLTEYHDSEEDDAEEEDSAVLNLSDEYDKIDIYGGQNLLQSYENLDHVSTATQKMGKYPSGSTQSTLCTSNRCRTDRSNALIRIPHKSLITMADINRFYKVADNEPSSEDEISQTINKDAAEKISPCLLVRESSEKNISPFNRI